MANRGNSRSHFCSRRTLQVIRLVSVSLILQSAYCLREQYITTDASGPGGENSTYTTGKPSSAFFAALLGLVLTFQAT